MMKKVIALFTAAAMVAATFTAADAAEDGLISVSEWAYPSVSAFRDTGLMPETMDGVTDYTQPITRGQYCELIYSVVKQSMEIPKADKQMFTDSDSEAVNALAAAEIVNGMGDGSFGADQLLTREAAAAIACRAIEYCKGRLVPDMAELYADDAKLSDWAREPIYALKRIGIMTGTDLGFDPAGTYTIEQAVTTMLRVYKKVPSFNPKQYDEVTGSEDNEGLYEIFTYSNGYKEVQQGDKLGIADSGNNILMSFGTDVYRALECVTRNDVTIVFAAPHKPGKVYAYDLETKEVLYTLDCDEISGLAKEYIVVKTQKMDSADPSKVEFLYGVYDYSGKQILPVEYDMKTLREKGYGGANGATGFVIGSSGSPIVIKGHSSDIEGYGGGGSAGSSGVSGKIDTDGNVTDIHRLGPNGKTITSGGGGGSSSSGKISTSGGGGGSSSSGKISTSGGGGSSSKEAILPVEPETKSDTYIQLYENKNDKNGRTVKGVMPFWEDEAKTAYIPIRYFAGVMAYYYEQTTDGIVKIHFGDNMLEYTDSLEAPETVKLNGHEAELKFKPIRALGQCCLAAEDVGRLFNFEVKTESESGKFKCVVLTGTDKSVIE